MKGPLGSFKLRDPLSDSVMAATGTGVAPFRSMLNTDTLASGKQFTLILGARYEEGLLYRTEFETLAGRFPNFKFVPVLSRPKDGWRGRTGHVQPHVMETAGDRRDLDVYMCGLKAMVDDLRAVLKQAGFDGKRLIYEKYD